MDASFLFRSPFSALISRVSNLRSLDGNGHLIASEMLIRTDSHIHRAARAVRTFKRRISFELCLKRAIKICFRWWRLCHIRLIRFTRSSALSVCVCRWQQLNGFYLHLTVHQLDWNSMPPLLFFKFQELWHCEMETSFVGRSDRQRWQWTHERRTPFWRCMR